MGNVGPLKKTDCADIKGWAECCGRQGECVWTSRGYEEKCRSFETLYDYESDYESQVKSSQLLVNLLDRNVDESLPEPYAYALYDDEKTMEIKISCLTKLPNLLYKE